MPHAPDRPGALLVNLGTPDAPEAPEVRRYLREFLSDPRVLDMNPVARWLLLNLIILPTRPARSAAAYKKVWMDEGSPLLVHGKALTAAVRERMPGWEVELAMRYGKPDLASGLEALRQRGCDRVVVFPLYPQYAASSTGSTVAAVAELIEAQWNTPYISFVPAFYEHPGFIAALARRGREAIDSIAADHVLFSFHGLPERHVKRSGGPGCLASKSCCDAIDVGNRNCYRAQSYATARALARALGLSQDGYTVSFQSRLGRDPWIKPYTDHVIPELAGRGVKRLAVFCPAFVADCLETLEEIGLAAAAQFRDAGGDTLTLVPAVNSEGDWADTVAEMLRACAGPPSVVPAAPVAQSPSKSA